jgi:hypothetical protein
MRLDTEIGRWYQVADDPSTSWEAKLAAYGGLLDAWVDDQRAVAGQSGG